MHRRHSVPHITTSATPEKTPRGTALKSCNLYRVRALHDRASLLACSSGGGRQRDAGKVTQSLSATNSAVEATAIGRAQDHEAAYEHRRASNNRAAGDSRSMQPGLMSQWAHHEALASPPFGMGRQPETRRSTLGLRVGCSGGRKDGVEEGSSLTTPIRP